MDDTPLQSGTWVVQSIAANPFWSWYAILLVELRDVPGMPPAHVHVKGDTHEVTVWVLDPEFDSNYTQGAINDIAIVGTTLRGRLLEPLNHGYQWNAGDFESASARCQMLFEEIRDGLLNPDPDARLIWDNRFADWHSLRK
jgi:hypothetical protein